MSTMTDDAAAEELLSALSAMPKGKGHRFEVRWVYRGDAESTVHRARASSGLGVKELLRDTLGSGRVIYMGIHVDGEQVWERFVTGTVEVPMRGGGHQMVWI